MVRSLIPTEPPDRKLSKIEILRLANSYIEHLQCQCRAGPDEDQPCMKIPRDSWQDSRIPVCTFCLSSQKKELYRPAQRKPTLPAASKRRQPLNRTSCRDSSTPAMASSFTSPWIPAHDTFKASPTVVQDSYRFPNTSTNPRVIQPVDPYRFHPPHPTVQTLPVGKMQIRHNLPALPTYDRFTLTYPKRKNILPSVHSVVAPPGLDSCPSTLENPLNLEYPEVDNSLLKQPMLAAQDKLNPVPDRFVLPYLTMNEIPPLIPFATSRNSVEYSQDNCCTSCQDCVMPAPAPHGATSTRAVTHWMTDTTTRDHDNTYVTTTKDTLSSSLPVVRDLSRSTPATSPQNGINMTTTFLQDEYRISSAKSEPILNPSSSGGDYPSAWGEYGSTDQQPYTAQPVSECSCQQCKGNHSRYGVEVDCLEESATGVFLNL